MQIQRMGQMTPLKTSTSIIYHLLTVFEKHDVGHNLTKFILFLEQWVVDGLLKLDISPGQIPAIVNPISFQTHRIVDSSVRSFWTGRVDHITEEEVASEKNKKTMIFTKYRASPSPDEMIDGVPKTE